MNSLPPLNHNRLARLRNNGGTTAPVFMLPCYAYSIATASDLSIVTIQAGIAL